MISDTKNPDIGLQIFDVCDALAEAPVAVEHEDGFVVRPAGRPGPATFETYDDHRMAMAFALVGLVVRGVEIRDPGCVAKTFPGFFDALEQLR